MPVVVLTSGTSWTKLGTVTLVEGWGSGGGRPSGGTAGGAYTQLANPTGVGSSVPITIGSCASGAVVNTNWNSGQLIAASGDDVGNAGLAANCTPSSGAFSGGAFVTNSGGGGSAGPDGAGKPSNVDGTTGGNGDNNLGGAGGAVAQDGVSNVLGGGGSGVSGNNAGLPGGGCGNGSPQSTNAGGQLRITYTASASDAGKYIARRPRKAPGKGPKPLVPRAPRGFPPGPVPDIGKYIAIRPRKAPGKGPKPLVVTPTKGIPYAVTTAPVGTGSIVFNGQSPSPDETVNPGLGNIQFNGFAPSFTNLSGYSSIPRIMPGGGPSPIRPSQVKAYPTSPNVSVNPGPGSIIFTGLAPSPDETVNPGVGSIVFNGQAPSPDETANPGVGSIVFNGLAPSPDETVNPGVGSIIFNGQAPSPDETVNLGVGSVVFQGYAPTAFDSTPSYTLRPRRRPGRGPKPVVPQAARGFPPPTNDVNASPGTGSLVFTGQAPSVDETVNPGAGSILFTGKTPSADESVTPGVGSIAFNGLAPSADENVLPGVGSIQFNGQAPTVVNGGTNINVTPDVGSILFNGFAPSIPVDTFVFPGNGIMTLSGFIPGVRIGLSGGRPDDDHDWFDTSGRDELRKRLLRKIREEIGVIKLDHPKSVKKVEKRVVEIEYEVLEQANRVELDNTTDIDALADRYVTLYVSQFSSIMRIQRRTDTIRDSEKAKDAAKQAELDRLDRIRRDDDDIISLLGSIL